MSNKLEQIQGIRALAILSVFVAHTYVWLGDDLGWIALVSGQIGGCGAITFFVLSGFLLSYKKKKVPKLNGKDMVKAAWNKAGKMYGLYLITLLVSFVAKMPTTPKDWIETLICVPFHLTLTQAFVPIYWVTNSFNGSAWFLSSLLGVWLLAYLCHGQINKFMSFSIRKSIVALFVILVIQMTWLLFAKNVMRPILVANHYLSWSYDWLIYSNPILCFSEYCVGVMIGQICVQKQYSLWAQNILGVTALCMITLFMVMIAMHVRIKIPWIVITECIVCPGLIAVSSPKTLGYYVLSTHALVWFGNISAYFFLIHGAVNFAMRATIADDIPKPWLFFVSLAVSMSLSACAEYYYANRIQRITIPVEQ